MRYKGLNDNQLTNMLGLSNGVIGKSRGDGRDLSRRVIELIENNFTDLNIEWLLTGDGQMLRDVTKNEKTNEIDRLLKIIESQQETISQLTKVVARMGLSIEKGDTISNSKIA